MTTPRTSVRYGAAALRPEKDTVMNSTSLTRAAGALLVLEGLLIFVPLAVLGAAINWPASLSEPPAVVLPLIQQQAEAVRLGYLAYLAYSVLFWPLALLTARVAAGSDTLPPLLRVAVGFGVASAVARTLGIIRWLVAMPALARIYTDPSSSDGTRAAVEVVYRALNEYAGSVGEVLGVTLFASLWLGCLAVHVLRRGGLPRWLGVFGLVASVGMLGGLVELFGVDLGPGIVIVTTLVQLWMLAAGAILLARRAEPQLTTAAA